MHGIITEILKRFIFLNSLLHVSDHSNFFFIKIRLRVFGRESALYVFLYLMGCVVHGVVGRVVLGRAGEVPLHLVDAVLQG